MVKLKFIAIILIATLWKTRVIAQTNGVERPNVILILADDMGFSDIGSYGGIINTPNLDMLAKEGVRFSQFYNGARCCPTRASLLTGLYAHQAGVGYMTAKLGNTPAYQGHIKSNVKTVGSYMKEVGYQTIQVGKWHVGNMGNNTMPLDKGFDKSWSPVGRVDYWNTKQAYINGKIVPVVTQRGDYLTDIEGDVAIDFINDAVKKSKPFFMYLAFNSAHWPLHAKPEDIAKYRGKFAQGWDVIREQKIKNISKLGLIEAIEPARIRDESVPLWTSYPKGDAFPGYHPVTSKKHDQDDWDLQMSVYAAQIDNMDQNIGRLIKKLKETGQYENTVIMFLQDNGACAEGIGKNDSAEPGTAESYIAYGLPWANLSNTPFKMYKHFLYEGGISTPFIFHWPKGIAKGRAGSIEKESFGHLIDVVPICLDVAGAYKPEKYKELEGQSLLPVINSKKENSKRAIYWEHEGNRAIRKGDWKLLSRYEEDYSYFKAWGWLKKPRISEWELYNIRNDRWELNDMAAKEPQIVAELKADYQKWYAKVGAQPWAQLIAADNKDAKDKKRKQLED